MEDRSEFDNRTSGITLATEPLGMLKAGKITQAKYDMLWDKVGQTCGSCSFLGTVNTMCCLAEAMRVSLPGNATIAATCADRSRAAQETSRQII